MMFSPLEFQKDAIDDLTKAFIAVWKKNERQLPLVFKSPTGSGKTFMAAHFVRGLNHLPNWDEDKAFIWITFSDDIAMQSKNKFEEYFENTLENGLLTVTDINKGKLQKNDILFLNWQKVVSRAAESRVLRRPEDEGQRKETGLYFEDFIDNTHKDNREIILVIDEAHTHVTHDLAQQVIDYINPKIVIHITATPAEEIELKSRRLNSFIEVARDRVIDEGLIKEKILVQTEEDLKKYKSEDLDEVLIDLGLSKRNEIIEAYKKLRKNINPLVLIQLPNDDRELVDLGQKTKEEIVTNLLIKKGIQEGKIAKWFDDHPRPEFLEENDDEHEFLLFKLAAGTGWDCPRAHILVMFREINSDTFYIQTVGRILRMPEPNQKEDYKNYSLLRTGFLFTNYERNKVNAKWNEISPNKQEIYVAQKKRGIENIRLEAAYVSRLEYGDLSNSAKFQMSFLKSMNKHFGIKEDDVLMGKASKKLSEFGIDLKPTIENQIIVDAKFQDFDQLGYEFKKAGKDIKLQMSRNDIEKTFNYYCYKILKEQTEEDAKITNIARSWGPLKSAIRVWLKSILSDDCDYYYRVFVNDIKKEASSKFRPAMTQALIDYKPLLIKLIEERRKLQEEREAPIFSIQDEYWYNEDYEDVSSKLCVLEKSYFLKEYLGKQNEKRFREYIDKKDKDIKWWFKNADYGKEYYSIKYWNSREQAYRLFYPDWIIRFKDGRIGIFDSKAGDTALPNGQGNTKDKAKALSIKLKDLGKNYIGGIAIFENGVWYYSNSEEYDYAPGRLNKDWKKFEDLF
ncbi:MAG: DEAD/DEAH box helicase family protein [Candidatus Omnitrophica bacterium]|nr:DEAD/DEAH box helicase family protein [Candidatus Omnitrophota bacterium]